MRKCQSCGTTESLMSSFDSCSFCLYDYLDKKAKEKAPPAEPRYSPFRTGKRGWSMDTINDMRFDDRQDIKRRGAYPLYDGVK